MVVDDIFALNINDENIAKNYHRYKIDQFAPILRDRLIRKWVRLTDDKSTNNYHDNAFYDKIDKATEFVNTSLGKLIDDGIMSSYPVFILSILSTHETFEKPLDQEITSQGYCYQALIYIYLRKQDVKNDEIDIYISFLSVLAYHFFSRNISELSESEFESFLNDYRKKYYLPIEISIILNNLQEQLMLIKTSLGNYRFLYRYLYYYFVAKYLSDNLVEKKNEIKKIVENLHKDENAYITIFFCHHTKNDFLLNEVIFNALIQFEDYKETALSKSELTFFDDALDYVAKAALPKGTSPEIERQKQLEAQEKQEKENEKKQNKTEENESKGDIYSNTLRRSIRTVEVTDIIAKNRMGSLGLERLEEIITEAININLRILSSFFDLIKDQNEERETINFISEKLQEIKNEKKSDVPNEKLEKEAKRIYWNLNFGVILGIIFKTIRSIGSDKLQCIIGEICDKKKTSVHLLIKHGVFMWYGKNIRVENILKDIKLNDISSTAREVLRYLIVYHCMLHDIDFNEKNIIQSNFGISSKALLRIESKNRK
jgi:ribosomal protein L12E/L44/L45/RPP1/RPP2